MPFSAKLVRWLRRFLIDAACLATLVAVIWQIEKIRGERAWNAAFKTYADRGDRLDALPAPETAISPHKNFWQTPLLSRLALARNDGPEMTEFKAADPLLNFSPTGMETWENGRPLNLDALVRDLAKYRREKKLPEPQSTSTSAALLLAQFPATDPVISELHTAALTRPDARLIRTHVPPLGQLFEMDMPSFTLVRQLTRRLQIHACAAVSARETEAAFASTLAALQLANGIGDHPYTLVEAMIAVVIQRLAIQPLWEGTHQHAWSDEQLARFTSVLSRSHLFDGLALSIRNERNNAIQLPLSSLKEKQTGLYRLMPEGWWLQNQVTYAGMNAPILLAIDSHSTPAFLDRLRASKLTPPSAFSPYKFIAWSFLPSYEKVAANTARSANAAHLALAACALERHYLAHGAYPDSLTTLVPAYLPAVPLDIINGDPLHYRRNSDGTFTLYSVGLDGDDDHGHRAPNRADFDTDGDWPW